LLRGDPEADAGQDSSGAALAACMNSSPFEVDPREAARMAANEVALIIDVREADELAICRLEGAHHVPMRQIPEAAADLPHDRPLLILCHHGGRSRRVCEYLRAQGVANVSNIRGGIDAWARDVDPKLARY
jgi:rhodanese-related sulfurtransferase